MQYHTVAQRSDVQYSNKFNVITRQKIVDTTGFHLKKPGGITIKVASMILKDLTWAQTPTLPPPDCVTLGRLLQPFG